MNLSFSTRGWPELTWDEMVDTALEMGFAGIEVYNLPKFSDMLAKGGPFHQYQTAATVRNLKEKKLTIPCFDTSCDLSTDPNAVATLTELMEVAKNAQVKYVVACALEDQEETVYNALRQLTPVAQKAGVSLLLKTSGIYADTARLRKMLDQFASDHLGALWDVHHPYRDFGESGDATIKNLGAYVCHVHLRDSDNTGAYQLIGEGTMPIADVMRALSSVNYDGFISLEWKPEWLEDLQDPEVIFPYFVNYMSRFHSTRGMKKSLYFNHDGTGQYIWKKDELIDLTFPQVLDRVAEEFPDQYCFKYTTLDYTRTYAEFREDVDRFARALVSMGVKAGSKVAIWATNVPAWYITFWATTKLGAVLVTVNTAYKIHEAEYLLRQSDTHTLVMIDSCLDSNYKAIINELCPEIAGTKAGAPLHCKRLPFLRNVITVGFKQPGCLTFDEAMARYSTVSREQVAQMATAVRPDDVCNMQYTSGTTGFPKGVMLTHYNVINNGKCIGDKMDLSTADRMMIQVPMFHCFGMVLSMTSSMTHGATLYPLPYFSPKPALECINREHITCFNGVPTMFIAMLRHDDFAKTDFSYIRTGIMAGANCPADLMREAADKMNMKEIVSVYGQTEASPGCTMSCVTDSLEVRTETVGSAFPNVECKIIDPETGEDLPDGANGEFVARGYNVMKGYYKMPLATASAIDADGWLHTGDIACRDADGNYRITGRLKDMIIRGGENIYPREIEEFIFTCPKVKDVQVIGVPDKRYGEEIMACIILKEGETMTVEELKAYVEQHMAKYKVPRYVDFVTEFPMNAAGKILKYKMREDAAKKFNLNV